MIRMGYTQKYNNPNIRDKRTAVKVLEDALEDYRETENPDDRHCKWKELEKLAQELRKAEVLTSLELNTIAIRAGRSDI